MEDNKSVDNPITDHIPGNPKLLVIDDDANFLFGISRLLTKADFTVIAATDGVTGIAKAQSECPDLILMDINMPKMTGFQVKKALEIDPVTQFIPVVFLTALNDDASMLAGLSLAEDYITKPVDSTILAARIKSILRRVKTGMRRAIIESDKSFSFERFKQWAYSVEMMDERSVGHTTRVANLAVTLAKSMGYIDDSFLENMYKGSFLHDIGKLAIPDKVLNKPGPLSAEEWELMRQHPLVASHMLSSVPILKNATEIPLMHHERWDGKGYPNHLAGEQIPISVRIFTIVDVYDALTSKRPYKEAISEENSLQIIRSLAGKQFDPAAVEHFATHFQEIISESEKLHQQYVQPEAG